MKTYTELTNEWRGYFFWHCDIGNNKLDVLVYDTQDDLDNDVDNSLAVARETVIDNREVK